MFVTDLTGLPVVVASLDADWLLQLVQDTEVRDREAARAKLRLAVRWCELHPATSESGVATWGETRLPELEKDESLGGEGTPLVAAFTPEPFAAALGVSPLSGMGLLADALDLVHRLPRIWARVESLAIPAWKARRVAQATHALSLAAATYVDTHLADRIETCGAATMERVVAMAIAKFHPEMLAKREKNGRAGWHVKVTHPRAGEFAGTSFLEASGDSLDLAKFYDLVCEQAATLGALGDTESLEVRKAKALGVGVSDLLCKGSVHLKGT